jgi:tRNA pseudouridine38-40 synthase
MQSINFRITIEYDGAGFHGWQRQNGYPTVQGQIENALEKVTGQQITVVGSGRTDAGVHALGQEAHFTCRTQLTPETIQRALNGLLPGTIVIRRCRTAQTCFHARYDAKRKTYRYRILNRPLAAAIGRQYSWHLRRPLDCEAMSEAAARLVGRHDFSSFEGTGSPRSNAVRRVFRARWQRQETSDILTFDIEADGFLRFMVRNIVGTLVWVGSGKIDAAAFGEILRSRERRRAGPTAPPQGLFLVGVAYG